MTILAMLGASAPAAAESFSTTAPIALLVDYESGAVLYEKNADQEFGPAQLAQLMTADVVFDELRAGRIHLDDEYAVSEYAWRTGGAHGHSTAMFLDVKSRARVEDLLRGLLIESGNDAALVFAEGISGSEAAFVGLMNKRAEDLGFTHTRYVNPYGKDDPDQKTTARELATLALHIIRDDADDYHYFSEKDFTWNKIHQMNRNPLLTMNIGADGLKAGDSGESGFNLVGSASENGQRLIAVVGGLKTATERAEEARKLFNFGFHAYDPRLLFSVGDTVGHAYVYGGAQGRVELVSDQPIKIFIPHGSTDRLLAKVVYDGPLAAPVADGAQVARLKVWRGTTLALDVPLKTRSAVPLGTLRQRAIDAALELAQGLVRRLFAKL